LAGADVAVGGAAAGASFVLSAPITNHAIVTTVPISTSATSPLITSFIVLAVGFDAAIWLATWSIRGSFGDSSLARAIAVFASFTRPRASSARARDRG
jgi:hypothetical protein